MKKRVLIDASTVTSIPDGLSIYVIQLLKHFPDAAFDEFDFSILVDPALDRPEFWKVVDARRFGRIEASIAPIGPKRDWKMRQVLKRHRGEFDLFHSTSNGFPLTLKGHVATIHDITYRRWFHDPGGIPGARFLAMGYLNRVIGHAVRRADRIITVSESTRREVAAAFNPNSERLARFRPIHLGWEHLLDYPEAGPDAPALPEAGYLFFLGSYRVHKNLARTLEAFERALPELPPGKMLLISGGSAKLGGALRERIHRLNAHGERVRFTGYSSNADIRRFYEQADAFVFPSLAEGFGIPALEAFHFGTPLLAARTTSIPEVAGDAALYFDPEDVGQIAGAMTRIYADPALGRALVAKGREQLKHFTWARTAEQTLDVYRECLA